MYAGLEKAHTVREDIWGCIRDAMQVGKGTWVSSSHEVGGGTEEVLCGLEKACGEWSWLGRRHRVHKRCRMGQGKHLRNDMGRKGKCGASNGGKIGQWKGSFLFTLSHPSLPSFSSLPPPSPPLHFPSSCWMGKGMKDYKSDWETIMEHWKGCSHDCNSLIRAIAWRSHNFSKCHSVN